MTDGEWSRAGRQPVPCNRMVSGGGNASHDDRRRARTEEELRLDEAREKDVPWKKWGPYLSERQWGTVREDYSEDGNAWDYFTHDQARSRAYHWGEDGLAGISDDQQRLCFALALWNGKDPILKERLFGLTNSEGNHGEDVKEYYFYLDSTPTHSYMKYLYKYPQAAYPYDDLVETNRQRGRNDMEYELLDTGVFNDDRYFDVFVEYAKADARGHPDPDQRVQSRAGGRHAARPADAVVSQYLDLVAGRSRNPSLQQADGARRCTHRRSVARRTGRALSCIAREMPPLLFTENETNNERLFGTPNARPYVKDGINNYVVHGQAGRGQPEQTGTKAAAHYQVDRGRREDRDRSGCGSATCRLLTWATRSAAVRPNHASAPARGGRVLSGDHSGHVSATMRRA